MKDAVARWVAPAVAGLVSSTVAGCAVFGDPVQRQWEDREPLPSCGQVQVAQTERLEDVGGAEVQCLEDAFAAGRGAELVLTYVSTEGDPIAEYRRVTSDGATEVYTDATKDTYGSGKWEFATCANPQSALDGPC